MSCIGKYKRNVIDFQETARWLLFWQASLLLNIPLQSALEGNQVLSKEAKFWLWNAKWFFLNESFIFMQLAIKVPDTKTKPVQSGSFFVQRPILEPRRPRSPVLKPRKLQKTEERNIEGSSGIQNGLGKQNGSENQRKHGKQNHQMTQRGFPSLPNVYDTSV